MAESKRPLELVTIAVLAILTLVALVLIFSDMQGWF